tara:strand:- start:634 stop:858 length:225 start_codon:yes stop_codon:yes gene_type:complete
MHIAPKKPKGKGKSLIKTSGAADLLMQYGPMAKTIVQGIADYGPPVAVGGAIAGFAAIRRKLKQIDRKYGGSQK